MKNVTSAGRWVREDIQQQSSYHVPPAGDFIKLDAMENPWPMPPEINRAWRESLNHLQLNRYPDPQAADLLPRLRSIMAVPDEAEIMLGNGSDELIQVILMALAGEHVTVLSPTPSFVMYEVLSRACGLDFTGVPLQQDFSLDMAAMRHAIEGYQPAVIFLASPNNPTGSTFQQSDIEEIIELAPGLVVVDEACRTCGTAGEVISSVVEDNKVFNKIKASPERVAGLDVPVPFSIPMENYVVPDKAKIVSAVRTVMDDIS